MLKKLKPMVSLGGTEAETRSGTFLYLQDISSIAKQMDYNARDQAFQSKPNQKHFHLISYGCSRKSDCIRKYIIQQIVNVEAIIVETRMETKTCHGISFGSRSEITVRKTSLVLGATRKKWGKEHPQSGETCLRNKR